MKRCRRTRPRRWLSCWLCIAACRAVRSARCAACRCRRCSSRASGTHHKKRERGAVEPGTYACHGPHWASSASRFPAVNLVQLLSSGRPRNCASRGRPGLAGASRFTAGRLPRALPHAKPTCRCLYGALKPPRGPHPQCEWRRPSIKHGGQQLMVAAQLAAAPTLLAAKFTAGRPP